MATRKVRRGRKTRGRKMRGGEGNDNAAPNGTLPAAVAAPVVANNSKKNAKPVGEPVEEEEVVANAAAVNTGGKRKTRKGGRRISRGASKWNQFVMRTFKEMRKKNKDVKLMDAMKECSKQKKKGIKY